MKLQKNLNLSGRLLRGAFAVILFVLATIYSSYTLLFAAIFCLFEALFSWCALFQIFGINQCRIKK